MMTRERDRRIDADTAERLLDGESVGLDRLESLLAAAAAPGRHGETTGEDAAVVAFRRASLEPHRTGARRSIVAGRGARLIGAKVAALVFSVAAGSVALAAGTGVLPNPLDMTPPAVSGSGLDRTSTASGADTGDADADRSGTTSAGAPSARPTPDPSLEGLCQAYVAQVGDDPGEALDNPALAALITAAGGSDNVATFCEDLLSEQQLGGPGRASQHPTGPPSDPPTAKLTKTSDQLSHPVRS